MSKRIVSDLMIYDVSGTPFWKVEMLTWCHGIPSFSKVKKGVPKTYCIIMFAGPFSAKSVKKERLRPYDLHCFRNAFLESGNVDLV